MRKGLLAPPQVLEGEGLVVVGGDAAGVKLERAVKMRKGLAVPVQCGQYSPHVVVRSDVARIEVYDSFVRGERLARAVRLLQGQRTVVARGRLPRVDPNRLAKACKRLLVVAHVGQYVAHVGEGGQVVWLGRDGSLAVGQGVGKASQIA